MKNTLPVIRGVVEIVATFSLLATLVIVAMALSANEKATRSATASEVALSLSAWYSNIGLERVGGKVFRQGMIEPKSVGDKDNQPLSRLFEITSITLKAKMGRN